MTVLNYRPFQRPVRVSSLILRSVVSHVLTIKCVTCILTGEYLLRELILKYYFPLSSSDEAASLLCINIRPSLIYVSGEIL